MNKKRYITTTLPYANSKPHIGHAFEFIIGDALSRYFRSTGEVFFNIGLDEHGLKIQQAADKEGITPHEYVDNLLNVWKDFVDKFNIEHDSFYRTSDAKHLDKVQDFWIRTFNNEDIYLKKYKGNYCVGCESFKLDKDLVEKTILGVDPISEDAEVQAHKIKVCPDHPTTELQEVEEENYFFILSKYREELKQWIADNSDFLSPKSKTTELTNIIDNIEDISVSRVKDSVSWGVPVPGDDSQTIYVWFDALLNYIFAVGHETWSNSEVIQICGPDNLKFQAVIFQSLLASAGIDKSDKLLVHGTILDADGRKMSKTLGNVVDPIDQLNKFGIDAVRYYALAGLSTYGNSAWDEERLVELYNSHLADDYGNLVARVTHLAGKIIENYDDIIRDTSELDYSYLEGDKFKVGVDLEVDEINKLWESYEINEALSRTNKLVKFGNRYINDEEPWKDLTERWLTVHELHYLLSEVTKLYAPVIPDKAIKVQEALDECKKAIVFPKIENKTLI